MHEKSLNQYNQDTTEAQISFDLYPATELYMAHESARREHWKKTGECLGPIVIGRLHVDDEIINEIARYLGPDLEYWPSEYPEQFLPDDEMAEKAANTEGSLFIANREIRSHLHSLWSALDAIIEADSTRLPEGVAAYTHMKYFSYGQYTEQAEEPHFDTFDDDMVRYAVTITGPTTIYYGGVVDPELFDPETGDLLDDAQIPDDTTEIHIPTLSVVRFLPGCDPHTSPMPRPDDEDQFRIFIDTTMKIVNEPEVERPS